MENNISLKVGLLPESITGKGMPKKWQTPPLCREISDILLGVSAERQYSPEGQWTFRLPHNSPIPL